MGISQLVADIRPGAAWSVPRYLTALGKVLVFSADDGTSGIELWRSDGTAVGTRRIADIHRGPEGDSTTPPASSFPNSIATVRGTLFFSANDGHGYELWSSDGTTAGTRRIADINRVPTASRRSGSSLPDGFAACGPGILFTADDGIHGRELWRTDGTAAGTTLLADIRAGDKRSGSDPSRLTALGRRIVCFSAFDDNSGRELWTSDGTTAGTERVADIHPGTASSSPSELTMVGNTLYFVADDGSSGRELWTTDGTAAGTERVADICPGSAGSNPFGFKAVGDRLLFFANDGITGNQLWRSDGSADGTVPLAKVPVPRNITFARDTLLFSISNRLWRSDGTANGTAPMGQLNRGRKGKQFPPNVLEAIGSTIYFDGWQERSGKELWRLDLSAPLRVDPGGGGVAGLV